MKTVVSNSVCYYNLCQSKKYILDVSENCEENLRTYSTSQHLHPINMRPEVSRFDIQDV